MYLIHAVVHNNLDFMKTVQEYECMFSRSIAHLFEWDESRGVSGTNTGATVTNGLVGHGELANVVVDHLGLDLDLVED